MKKLSIVFLLFITTYNTFSQTDKNCNTLLQNKLNIQEINSNPQEFKQNTLSLFNCMKLNDHDIYTLTNTPVFSSLLIQVASNNSATYLDLKNKIDSTMKTEEFIRLKKQTKSIIELENTIASIENWDKIQKILESIKAPQEIVNKVHQYLKENKNSSPITFKELSEKLFK